MGLRFVSVAMTAGLACVVMDAAGAETLTVAYYGGSWGDAIRKCMIAP